MTDGDANLYITIAGAFTDDSDYSSNNPLNNMGCFISHRHTGNVK